jgi:hypothetical protein
MSNIDPIIRMPCGGEAHFDHGAGYGYRCWDCMAVVGSMGQPRSCKDEMDKYEILKKLGGSVSWDYNKGCEVSK